MLYMADAYMGKAHVTADQIGDYNAGVSGSGCVLNVGEKLRAEIINANLVRIYDGAFIFQGYRRSGITAGSYEDVTIENGTQAQKRNDLICAKYEKDNATSKENLTLAVIKGIPGDTAADPSVPEGNVRSGNAVCYMPLYRVKLDGISVTGLESLFAVRDTMEQLEEKLNVGYSLKNAVEIPEGADLDDYKTFGNYYSTNAANTSTLTNAPDRISAGFVLHVERCTGDIAGNYIMQRIVANNVDFPEFFRCYVNGVWSDWHTMTYVEDITHNVTPIITTTSGVQPSVELCKGNSGIYYLRLGFNITSAVAPGSNIWEGTIKINGKNAYGLGAFYQTKAMAVANVYGGACTVRVVGSTNIGAGTVGLNMVLFI